MGDLKKRIKYIDVKQNFYQLKIKRANGTSF